MIERNCWTILAQRAQDETTLIQTEIGQITTRLENLNASKERLQNLYEEYRKQENSTNSNLLGMREVINQRQFMTQLLTLMERVDADVASAQKQLTDTRRRLMESEQERLKMQSLADQNAQAILNLAEKRDQRRMDELGVMQFNLRDDT
ncbi:flagellar export protein FliJ [Limnohabitans sp. Rim8]|uniref:flagellar export protein FliJ n=1 Tax=Limnohabitans sp. Rim8 TaxID=1100718 RepID=UPI00262E728C|nr:flagellar export protein FliJ [Limnohabitans sp. Rim8]